MRYLAGIAALPLFVAISTDAAAQGYEPVDSPLSCKEDETPEECRKRLCKPDETDEECQKRIIEERKKNQQQGKDDRDRDRDRDRDDDDDYDEDEYDDDRDDEDRDDYDEDDRDDYDEDDRDDYDEDEDDYDDDGGSSSEILRPGTRPMFFTGAIGPSFFGINRGRRFGDPGYAGGRGRVALDFGYHFSGDFEGPAIGATIEQSFNERYYVFNPGFKFWWDIQPVDKYGIYIAPFAKAGYALAACSRRFVGPFYDPCPYHAFNLGLGVEGRLVLGNRGVVLLRPVQLDTYLGNFFRSTFWLEYSLLVGGGVTF